MSTNRNRARKPAPRRRSPLPLLLMAGGLVLIIAAIAINLAGSGDASGTPDLEVNEVQVTPQAAVEGLQVDFGDMQLGAENAEVNVRVTNTGDGVLRFEKEPYVELAAGC